jgi:ubiquinone/menaquinone biosynthesis C-methylase UbiE
VTPFVGTPEEAKRRAAATYNAAADTYDHPANSFWDRHGRRTVERLVLPPKARVLDACCGSGASAIPAAEAVGPQGSVLGVDLAEKLLERARARASARGLANVEFRVGDLLDLGLPDAAFDAVVCVFGIFFVPDMEAAARELWRRVRPGGQLAITTWGPRFFEPVNSVFWDAVRAVRPELHKGFNPWDRISEPAAVRSLLAAAGCEEATVVAESGSQPLATPEDWWQMVLGSGYRGTVEQMEVGERDRVRSDCLAFIRASAASSVEANVVYARARKPGP